MVTCDTGIPAGERKIGSTAATPAGGLGRYLNA